jgi:hypothetical protein
MIAQMPVNMLQQPTVMIAEEKSQLAGRKRVHRSAFQMLVRVVLNITCVAGGSANGVWPYSPPIAGS